MKSQVAVVELYFGSVCCVLTRRKKHARFEYTNKPCHTMSAQKTYGFH